MVELLLCRSFLKWGLCMFFFLKLTVYLMIFDVKNFWRYFVIVLAIIFSFLITIYACKRMVHQYVDIYRLLWSTYSSWNYLNIFSSRFKLVLYGRCVDDIFLFFRCHSRIILIFYYLNAKHVRINFTFKVQTNSSFFFRYQCS